MALTNKHHQMAMQIDTFVNNTISKGRIEKILLEMLPYVALLAQIMETTSRPEMETLCRTYKGLFRFVRILEKLTRGMENGTIEMPEDIEKVWSICKDW